MKNIKQIEEHIQKNSLKIKDFGPILRLVLTFSTATSGGIFDVVAALGKVEAVRRIDDALKQVD